MSRRSTSLFEDEKAARAAIAYAEKWAGRDNAVFLDALDKHYRGSVAPRTRERGAAGAPTKASPTAATSFHIFQDPRFLKNARALAKRALGGTRVIGGRPVPSTEFLDCVAVGSDAEWGCTGTLIGPNVVLTAGHCADYATRVFFGTDVAKQGTVVAVKKRVRHPKYHRGNHNDLMVLVLERAVSVPPRKIAPKALIDKMTDGRVVGFGHTDPSGSFGYGVKRQVDVPVASPRCAGKVDGHDDAVSYGCDVGLEIVAGRPLLARDSCSGDSGGPFYIRHKKDWLIAGATSRATDSAVNNCGDGGIYARIDAYRAWIAGVPGVTLAS